MEKTVTSLVGAKETELICAIRANDSAVPKIISHSVARACDPELLFRSGKSDHALDQAQRAKAVPE
ncbi:MAG: hypothetical protein ACRDKX_09635, partial [Solirubrobacterales bacterium]